MDFGATQAFYPTELEGTLDVGDSMVIVPSNAKALPNVVETIFFCNDLNVMIISSVATIVIIEIYFVITCVDVITKTSIRLKETNTCSVTIPSTFSVPKTIGLITIIEVVGLVEVIVMED